ncbi:MAG TPA: hypothetical protein ENJ42_05905 [Hellea balneolensis]|uniref:Uncharacterized protein n=1 Tax=Hellea balneolensis TaxID=287478 RepID=A0A7C5M191_9PROT|nr:hypothetical protein [Hellea balneolensis]
MKNKLHNAHVLCAFAGLALFVSACKDNPEAKDTKTAAPSYASTYAPRPAKLYLSRTPTLLTVLAAN